jgi:hypothetical protein
VTTEELLQFEGPVIEILPDARYLVRSTAVMSAVPIRRGV